MADENNTSTETKKSGGKGLIIVLIVLILVLIGVAGGAGYYFYMQNSAVPQTEQNASQSSTTQQANSAKETNPDQEFFQVAINDLVLNITNSKGREKLMKLSFAIKSTNPAIESIVEANKAEMVDVVIQQVSARNSEELLTVGGKELLKEELIDELNRVLNNSKGEEEFKNSIKNIFFTTFVIK